MSAFEKWKGENFTGKIDVGDLEDAFNAGFHHSRENPKPVPLPRTVTASIRGGVFEVESCDPGIEMVVRDYDTEGADPDRIEDDGSGEDCVKMEFGE